MANDEPPFLSVGTDVSAKYKGAFCEAKIKKVQRSVKCRLSFKSVMGGSVIVPDDHIKGSLKVGSTVEAKHPDKPGHFQEATVIKIIDQSQYTVVFDDGDVTTLRRTSLCLKSGKHYMDGESLDQLPLTNPEHFSAPVAPTAGTSGGSSNAGNSPAPGETRSAGAQAREQLGKSGMPPRKKRTAASLGEFLCREGGDASSQEEDEPETTPRRKRNQPAQPTNLTPRESRNRSAMSPGTVILIEVERKDEKPPRGSDTPRSKRDYVSAPALILRDQSGIKRDEIRIKLFRDGQVMVVAKKEVNEFDRKLILKGNPQKSACFKALVYCEKGELPQGWNRKELLEEPADTEEDNEGDEAEEDDENEEARDTDEEQEDEDETDPEDEVHDEEKDRFVAQLYKFMDERGTPINKAPVVNGKDLDLHQLFSTVQKIGSFDKVTNLNKWKDVYSKLFKEPKATPAQGHQLKTAYKKYLQGFEDLYRKLGMGSSLDAKVSSSGGRSQRIMTRNKQIPVNVFKARERKAVTPQPDSPTLSVGKNKDKDAAVEEEKRSVRKKINEDRDAGSVTPKRVRSDSLDNTTKKAKEKAAAMAALKNNKDKDEKPGASSANGAGSAAGGVSSAGVTGGPGAASGGGGGGGTGGGGGGGPKKKKEKNSDTEASETEATPQKKNALIEPIRVNDRIKVKYGHGKQHKVYEAKVLKIEDAEGDNNEKKYFVHYTGWNNRYDEWIQKKRILENITLKQDKGRPSGAGRKSAAAAAEREKKQDDKESSNSPSEPKNATAETLPKRDRSTEKDFATPAPKKTRDAAKEKDDASNEEPRKRRGKPPKKFAEEAAPPETSVQTRQKDQTPTKDKDNSSLKDANKQKDEEVAKEKKPAEVMKDEKKEGATSTATAKTVKEEKKQSGPPSSSNESQGAAHVKKLVEESPETTARVFAVKSKPPESSPPPAAVIPSSTPVVPSAAAVTATVTVPETSVPVPVIEKQSPSVAGKKEKVEIKKEKIDEDSKDSAAPEKQTSTPKRSRVAKRKKGSTTPSSSGTTTAVAAAATPPPAVSAVHAAVPTVVNSGSSGTTTTSITTSTSATIASTTTSVIATATATPSESTQATAALTTAPISSAKDVIDVESAVKKTEPTEREEVTVLTPKIAAAVIPDAINTTAASTSTTLPVPAPKEEQSEGEDTDIEKDLIEPTITGPSVVTATAPQPAASGASGITGSVGAVGDETTITQDEDDEADDNENKEDDDNDDDDRDDERTKIVKPEEEASTEVEEGHMEDSLTDNQLMDLDESGVEAFEAETVATNAESTPTTFANVTPLTSSTPRTSSVVVSEISTPVVSKTRKPRGLKKVEEEEKEKTEDTVTKVKDEKPQEEKKLPTAVKSRARKISEPPEEESGSSRKRPRKTPEATSGFASKLNAIQTPTPVKEIPVEEALKVPPTEVAKKPESDERIRTEPQEIEKPSPATASSSGKALIEEVKQKEKDGKELRNDQPSTSYMSKKRKPILKLDEDSQPSPPSVPVVAKKSRVEELKPAEKSVKQEIKEVDTESETSEEKGDATDEIGEVEERGEELKRREAERAAAGDVLASLANACGPKEPEQSGGLFLICEENVLPESPVPNNNNNQDNNDVAGPAHAADEDAAPNRAEISSACVTEVTPPTTPDDSQSSASNQNAPSNPNNRRNAVGGQGSARGSEGPGPVDEESTMSADSSDSARPSAVEREREKAVRGKGGLGGAGRGRTKRTRKTLRQKAGQRRAERASPDHHAGQRGEGRHVGLMCAQMPPNYDPVRPSKYNFLLPIDENLDADERIGIIQDRLCELKKTYLSLKSEIAVIDRKRKRLRRREAARTADGSTTNSPRHHPSPLRTATED